MAKYRKTSNFCGACSQNFSYAAGRDGARVETDDNVPSPTNNTTSPKSELVPVPRPIYILESKFEDANGNPMPFITYSKGTELKAIEYGNRYEYKGAYIQKQFVSLTNPNAYAPNSASKYWYLVNGYQIRDGRGNVVSMAIDQSRPIMGTVQGNDIVFLASNGEKYYVATWHVSEVINGKPYGTNPALAINVGGLNDRFTVMLQRAYQPTNYEMAEMLRLGTLEKWKQVNDFIGAFLKANISNLAYQVIDIGDLESYDFERDITTRYIGVKIALQGVTQSSFKLIARYTDETGFTRNNGTLNAYLSGNYVVNADLPYGQEFSLAWFMKNILLDQIFLKLKIGQTGWTGKGYSTVAVDHTVTDTSQKIGETTEQWKARIEAEMRSKLFEEIQKSQERANAETKASAERTAQNMTVAENIRQQEDFRTEVLRETQTVQDKYEAQRRAVEQAQNIQRAAQEAQKIGESTAKLQLEVDARTDLIAKAMQAGASSVNTNAGIYTANLTKPVTANNKIKVDLTQTAKNQMATNPNADWTKVNEIEKTVWGSDGKPTAQDATFAAQNSQARVESDNTNTSNPNQTSEKSSNIWLWVGGILLLAALGGGGWYYYENYYKKEK